METKLKALVEKLSDIHTKVKEENSEHWLLTTHAGFVLTNHPSRECDT